MRPQKRAYILLFILFIPCFGIAQSQIQIIPKPVSLTAEDGHFIIDKNTSLIFKTDKNDLQRAALFFNSFIKSVSGITLPLNDKRSRSVILEIKKTANIGNEGYLLNVSPSSIKIIANSKAGIIYGMQTVFQTLPQIRTNVALEVPCMKVTDYPAFKWRGMHLDVCRHFFSPEMVKEYIDLLSEYKFNTFHWHLTDDQGWRIEIKKYPKLTSVGAWRADRRGIPWSDASPPNRERQQLTEDIIRSSRFAR